jgi:hypothetical protein
VDQDDRRVRESLDEAWLRESGMKVCGTHVG